MVPCKNPGLVVDVGSVRTWEAGTDGILGLVTADFHVQ